MLVTVALFIDLSAAFIPNTHIMPIYSMECPLYFPLAQMSPCAIVRSGRIGEGGGVCYYIFRFIYKHEGGGSARNLLSCISASAINNNIIWLTYFMPFQPLPYFHGAASAVNVSNDFLIMLFIFLLFIITWIKAYNLLLTWRQRRCICWPYPRSHPFLHSSIPGCSWWVDSAPTRVGSLQGLSSHRHGAR